MNKTEGRALPSGSLQSSQGDSKKQTSGGDKNENEANTEGWKMVRTSVLDQWSRRTLVRR